MRLFLPLQGRDRAMKTGNQNKDFFSSGFLSEWAEIENHMAFISGLVKKYGERPDEKNLRPGFKEDGHDWVQISRQLARIRERMEDPKLNISVIGEFSTGKSTFINALLRHELLVSSAVQGTTTASTVIEYDSRYRIRLQYLDNQDDQEICYMNFPEFKKDLDWFTTDSFISRTLRAVNVCLPTDILKNHFRIIDTPGTNVTEAWHEDITVRTLKEESDLSIVLISAEKPVPDTMLRFMENHLASILPQCVFVVTKLDMIPKRERERQLSYIRMKLEDGLGIRDAVVLPYVSPMVLYQQPENIPKDWNLTIDDALLNLSLETEREFLLHTLKERTLVVIKKLTGLMDDIYCSISGEMEYLSNGYKSRLLLLERSRKTDLNLFVQDEKACRLECYDRTIAAQVEDIENKIHKQAANAQNAILEKIDEKKNINELKAYIDQSLGADCSQRARNMIALMDNYYREIRSRFRVQMQLFNQSFVKNYQNLEILPIDFSNEDYQFPQKVEIATANLDSIANCIAEKLASENKAYLGGAATGAVLGTTILPGIGTIAGAFIGGIAGAFCAPNMDDVRKECKEKLKPQLINYYNSVSIQMMSAAAQYIDQLRLCLSNEMDAYLKRYRNEVRRQIAFINEQQSVIDLKVYDLKRDQEQMRNHKIRLESIMVQLNKFGRKEE